MLDKHNRMTGEVLAGHVFGQCVLEGKPLRRSARALSLCHLFHVPAWAFARLRAQYPRFIEHLVAASRLQHDPADEPVAGEKKAAAAGRSKL